MTSIQLKFIFPNQDGVSVEFSQEMATKVADVKARLMEQWPKQVEGVDSAGSFKLISMGKLLVDEKTLKGAR